MGGANPGLKSNPQTIGLVVGFYFFISITLVLLNKSILSGSSFSLPAPLFVVWLQLVISVICLFGLGEIGKRDLTSIRYPAFHYVPTFEFDPEKAQKTLPLSLIFIGMIVFNNLCLLYVEVSFYQIARSLTIFFNIIFGYYILGTQTSWAAIRACAVVVVGFCLGSLGEANFSWSGIIYGITSSVFVALYSIYVKKCMPLVGGDHWRLMVYNNLTSLVILFPIMFLAGDHEVLAESPAVGYFTFWLGMLITGLFGFLINIAIFLQIKYTSPLTNNLAGTAKACVQTLIAVIIFRNQITLLNAFGILLVIVGSFLYSHVRYIEMITEENHRQKEVSV